MGKVVKKASGGRDKSEMRKKIGGRGKAVVRKKTTAGGKAVASGRAGDKAKRSRPSARSSSGKIVKATAKRQAGKSVGKKAAAKGRGRRASASSRKIPSGKPVSTTRLGFMEAVAARLGVSEDRGRILVDALFDELLRKVIRGPVKTPLGTFLVREIKSRNVYDISRDEVVLHPPSRVLRLFVSAAVDQRIKRSRAVSISSRGRRVS